MAFTSIYISFCFQIQRGEGGRETTYSFLLLMALMSMYTPFSFQRERGGEGGGGGKEQRNGERQTDRQREVKGEGGGWGEREILTVNSSAMRSEQAYTSFTTESKQASEQRSFLF